jgi:hypothetical protein
MDIYRKIWIKHNGPIPKDIDGRTFEVHHLDGNRKNNDISNLVCVSIQEHYDIHLSQGDYAACILIAKRINTSPQLLSELATKNNLERSKRPGFVSVFAKRPDGSSVASDQASNPEWNSPFSKRPDGSSVASDLVSKGKHHLLKRNDGSSLTKDRVTNGTNPFLKQFRKTVVCPHCGKTGDNSIMKRWHFDKCRYKDSSSS